VRDKVTEFFKAEEGGFDDIYSGRKNRVAAWLDRVFRWDMRARYEETLRECGDASGLRVLDVGCGSGRYMIPLARRGAHVTGVDSAEEMIDLARRLAREAGVDNRCAFLKGDFPSTAISGPFDITLAIGFFDYIKDPHACLTAMRRLTRGRLIATFPRFWTWRAPVRKVRLALKGCPVYFYTREGVARLLGEAGWGELRVKRVGKLHFIVAHAGDKEKRNG